MCKRAVRVAIVDDDDAVRKALARLLSALAYETYTYTSAEDFIAVGLLFEPDCLLVDLQMPGFGGLDLQRRLRAEKITIPMIIVTAHNEAGLRDRCNSEGVSDLLIKPLDQESLTRAIGLAVAKR